MFSIFRETKCLLCSSVFKNQKELLDHYISYHNVDENNWFFQKLFQTNKNKAFLKNCISCDQFLTTKKEKVIHDFLKHYNEGKDIPFKEKLLGIIRYSSLLIYQIEYKKYGNSCSFFNSEKCINEFLQIVKLNFTPQVKNDLNVFLLLKIHKIQLAQIYSLYLTQGIGQLRHMIAFILMSLYTMH